MKIATLFIFLLTVFTVSATPLHELLKRGGGGDNCEFTCEQAYQAALHSGYSHYCWDDGHGTCQCNPCEQLHEWGNDHLCDHHGDTNLYCTNQDYSGCTLDVLIGLLLGLLSGLLGLIESIDDCLSRACPSLTYLCSTCKCF